MRIGIVGGWMIGSTVAKLWVDAGHEVRLASRHPEDLQPLVERLGERASAGTPTEAAKFGEVVMLTVPLAAIPDLARDLAPSLAGKTTLTPSSNGYFLSVFFPTDNADFSWNGAILSADNLTGDAWYGPVTYFPAVVEY